MAMDHPIEFNGLTKRYGRRRGVQDIHLSVGRGSIYGFLGPNGAGKTTTIRLLMGLLRPTSGSARICGLDIVKQSLAIRKKIGYLPGEVHFFNHLTGYATLKYLADLRGLDCSIQSGTTRPGTGFGSIRQGSRPQPGNATKARYHPGDDARTGGPDSR